MAGGVLVMLAPDDAAREQLARLADHRKTGFSAEDDATGTLLVFGPHHWEAHSTHHPAAPHGFQAFHNPAKNELSLRAPADNDLAHGYHTLLDLTAWLMGKVPQATLIEALIWIERWPLPPGTLGYADFQWNPTRRAWELVDGDEPVG